VKDREIIADKSPQSRLALRLHLKYGSRRPTIWVAAAEREDEGRFIVRADEKLTAFLELESAIQAHRHNHECDCPELDEELGSNRR
jgi:hypothetical protein